MRKYQEPKQKIAVDQMKKKRFVVDYIAKGIVYMHRRYAGLTRYVRIASDGLVNGQPAMAYL